MNKRFVAALLEALLLALSHASARALTACALVSSNELLVYFGHLPETEFCGNRISISDVDNRISPI